MSGTLGVALHKMFKVVDGAENLEQITVPLLPVLCRLSLGIRDGTISA